MYKFLLSWDDKQLAKFLTENGYQVTFDYDTSFDAVIFPGGEDIHPYLYGEMPYNGKTEAYNVRRDMREVGLYKSLVSRANPKIGVCRGAQLLNVLNGGSLWQDVDNHLGTHEACDYTGETKILVTSTHHQQMIPHYDGELLLLANRSTKKKGADYKGLSRTIEIIPEQNTDCIWDWDDAEAVYYPKTNTFCFQPHPEYKIASNKECSKFFLDFLENKMFPILAAKREALKKAGV